LKYPFVFGIIFDIILIIWIVANKIKYYPYKNPINIKREELRRVLFFKGLEFIG